jgi:hypothetical protein
MPYTLKFSFHDSVSINITDKIIINNNVTLIIFHCGVPK